MKVIRELGLSFAGRREDSATRSSSSLAGLAKISKSTTIGSRNKVFAFSKCGESSTAGQSYRNLLSMGRVALSSSQVLKCMNSQRIVSFALTPLFDLGLVYETNFTANVLYPTPKNSHLIDLSRLVILLVSLARDQPEDLQNCGDLYLSTEVHKQNQENRLSIIASNRSQMEICVRSLWV